MGLRTIFILCLFSLIACGATAKFPFRAYGLMPNSFEGRLISPTTPNGDLDLKECEPDAKVKGKCLVLLREEFFKLKADYLDIKQKLLDLQKRCPQ